MHLFRQHAPRDSDSALAQLPVIDLGPILAGEDVARDALAAAIARACTATGFFYIANHGVS